MPVQILPTAGSRLLRSLPQRDYRRLEPAFEPVTLALGQVLCQAGQSLSHVHFPDSGVVSLLASADDHATLEAGMVGSEGMVGVSALLGAERCAGSAVVRVAGSATRVPVAALREEISRDGALRHVLDLYTHALLAQLAQAVACNRFHSVEERFARWLLMTRDRLRCNEFHMTQESMSHALGVRREGITAAASRFQRTGLISYCRGHVAILDAAGIEGAACACYRIINAQYERIPG
jgi:CRP-like cAMP-binding protein